jgi:Protein of unknown function (DUF2695)
MNTDTLTTEHPRWPEFVRAMETRSQCDHTLTYTRKALRDLGLDEEASIAWLEGRGGYCDCEVAMNALDADRGRQDEARSEDG